MVSKLKKVSEDPYAVAVFFLSFLMVFVKKWEPGGNLDTIWDSALARNIAETGDYFHWFISRHYLNPIFDHMPMTYWILATLMKIFGVSDLVARAYPMVCSFFSYVLVYKIGKFLKDKDFGLVCLISYVSVFGSSKWNGAVTQDVPLTTYYLAAFYTFLLAKKNPAYLMATAFFFGLGIFTKGPIIFGFALGLFLWSAAKKDFWYLKKMEFYWGLGILMGMLMIPLIPGLWFDGLTVYQKFFNAKFSYLAPSSNDAGHIFAYFTLIPQTATLSLVPFFLTFWVIKEKKSSLSKESTSVIWLTLIVAASILVPLSFFKVKFPHYLLTFYPFMALFAAPSLYVGYLWLQKKVKFNFPLTMKRIALAALCIFVSLPIKTTGAREKYDLNITNIVKLDSDIKNKEVYFYGTYQDDMIIFQTFKLYGGIDMRSIEGDAVKNIDFKNSYLIIPSNKLPIVFGDFKIEEKDCLFKNSGRCAVTDVTNVTFTFPDKKFPHEIY